MVKKITQFILNEYGVCFEHPFKGDDTMVFRNSRNKKWFAIIMKIPASKIGLEGDLIDIINLKNHPDTVSMLRGIKGIYPAYHMNKENWITVELNKKLPLEMVIPLIDESYQIIDKK